jgi:hypothetical protein
MTKSSCKQNSLIVGEVEKRTALRLSTILRSKKDLSAFPISREVLTCGKCAETGREDPHWRQEQKIQIIFVFIVFVILFRKFLEEDLLGCAW